jgi:hypothetical protein
VKGLLINQIGNCLNLVTRNKILNRASKIYQFANNMEWRIFFPLLRTDIPSIDILSHLFKNKTSFYPEVRTDQYIILSSVQYGLKLRNTTSHRPLLELKVRSKVESDGNYLANIFLLSEHRNRILEQSDCK